MFVYVRNICIFAFENLGEYYEKCYYLRVEILHRRLQVDDLGS